jgi:replicative DNA helicase
MELTILSSDQPPSAIDIERSVIGSFLSDKAIFDGFSPMIKSEYFTLPQLADIFCYMVLHNTCDMLVIMNKFPSYGVVVAECFEQAAQSVNLAPHVDILQDRYYRRMLLQTADYMAQEAQHNYEVSPKEIIDRVQQDTMALTFKTSSHKLEHISPILGRVFHDLDEMHHNRKLGLQTGLPDVDEEIGGFQNGELVLIAARPSMGKSSFALNVCTHNGIREKKKIIVFSLEMDKNLTGARALFGEASLSYDLAKRGLLPKAGYEKLRDTVGPISDAPIYIDDTPGIKLSEIWNKCAQLKNKIGLDLVFIDHMQIMGTGKGRSRNEEMSEISAGLKNLAREFNIPVIALSQLNRSVDSRTPPRPMLSDLRDSGSLEQDADMVIFLYRPEKYNREEKPGICEVIVAKNRNGRTGLKEIKFDEPTMNFRCIDKKHEDDYTDKF